MIQGAFGNRVLDGRQVHLRVLATSDLHMHLMPFDYARNRPSVQVGLARTAGLVAAARAEARNVLLVDNGDFLQGNPMADMAARDAGPNPAIVAMNGMGYDAAALGNHEFDYGLPVLERALADARFPVLAANAVVGPEGDATLTAPWTILRREVCDLTGRATVLNIGLIGLLPPQVAVWSRDHVAGRVAFRGIVETAAAMVPQMRAAGADIVVALAHTGIGEECGGAEMENAAVPLARVAGIDALVLGHSHLVFPSERFDAVAGVDAVAGLVGGKPAVMPGAFGSHLGVMDLLVQPEGDGWRVAASSVAARPVAALRGDGRAVARVRPDAGVVAAAEAAHGQVRAMVARPVGRSGQRLTTHFALVADTAAVRLVAEAKAAFVRAALGEDVPVLGAAAPFRTGGRMGPGGYADIPAGRLAARHLAELYPFPNLLRAVQVDGRQVRRWLEQSAALFNRVAPGDRDVPLIAADAPGYAFDMIGGLTFEIRVDRPVGQRIADLRHGGVPVAEDAVFVVASNSYRVAASASEAVPLPLGDMPVREVLERHVAAGGAARIGDGPGWRLRLPAGASVVFPTAPAARVPAEGLGGLAAIDLGLGADGFRRVRLSAGEG